MQQPEREQRMTTNQDTFTAYAVGFAYASVCTSLNDTEATTRMNHENPTGIESQWEIADEAFASGDPNGRPCNEHPNTHRHLLFVC